MTEEILSHCDRCDNHRVVMVAGPVCSGKSRTVQEVRRARKHVVFHPGGIIRSMVDMESMSHVPDLNQFEIFNELVMFCAIESLFVGQNLCLPVVMDGFPRGVDQFRGFLESVEGRALARIDMVVAFAGASPTVLEERAINRHGDVKDRKLELARLYQSMSADRDLRNCVIDMCNRPSRESSVIGSLSWLNLKS